MFQDTHFYLSCPVVGQTFLSILEVGTPHWQSTGSEKHLPIQPHVLSATPGDRTRFIQSPVRSFERISGNGTFQLSVLDSQEALCGASGTRTSRVNQSLMGAAQLRL